MTTLQEAAMRKALEALEAPTPGALTGSAESWSIWYDKRFIAMEELRTALEQQREQQPVCHGCGIPAGDVHMSTCKSGKWPSRVSNGDTAAPAPQPAQGVGRTNPGDETGGAVERFGWQTFLGKSPEIIPATNGSFVWYSDYLKLWQSAQPKQEPLRELTEPQVHGIAHRKSTRYTYIAKPSEVMYGFSKTHIVDFVRAIEKARAE